MITMREYGGWAVGQGRAGRSRAEPPAGRGALEDAVAAGRRTQNHRKFTS
jgi:hypothetical protein